MKPKSPEQIMHWKAKDITWEHRSHDSKYNVWYKTTGCNSTFIECSGLNIGSISLTSIWKIFDPRVMVLGSFIDFRKQGLVGGLCIIGGMLSKVTEGPHSLPCSSFSASWLKVWPICSYSLSHHHVSQSTTPSELSHCRWHAFELPKLWTE